MTNFSHSDTAWFVHDRFGMFIHWGLYAMPARHEWVRNYEQIPDEPYRKYFEEFNPDDFQPRLWAQAARRAGMKYFVITTKHHEGFCLWDSAYTDYKITNTPFRRDALREIVEAFRAEGLRVGFYYSLIDWHHPDFTVDSVHPLRNHPDREQLNCGRDMARYREYLFNQVRELLTGFGPIDILWFDFSYPFWEGGKGCKDWDSENLVKMIRSLQPGIILNNRLDLPGVGDIITPEQYAPDAPLRDENGNPAVWEGCQTFSGSWGYHRDEMTWKSAKQCIDLLINHVCCNGNLLMNVGPNARGQFDARAMQRLDDFGRWMSANSRSIYGCGPAPEEFPVPRDCRYTWNPETRRLYLHIMNWPFKHIHLYKLAGKLKYAQFLHDGSEVLLRESASEIHEGLNSKSPAGAATLDFPVVKPDVEVPVVELFLK